MSMLASSIYDTMISHRRRRPKAHKLSYGAFYLLLDLDELDGMHRQMKWFSHNSFNIFSFHDKDHGPGTKEPLRPWIEHHLQQAGIQIDGGRIEILCLPRILGYAFNPISVYYCYHRDGQLLGVMYQVSNTFGQRHSYLFSVAADSGKLIKHSCKKNFYVSPFMDVSGHYEFALQRPVEKLYLHIRQADSDGPILDAWVNGTKAHISDGALLARLARYPLLTLKVIGGIHWEALKLWLKGIGLYARPEPPAEAVTIISDLSVQPTNVADNYSGNTA
jgi:DUF1365 family protein